VLIVFLNSLFDSNKTETKLCFFQWYHFISVSFRCCVHRNQNVKTDNQNLM